MTGLDAIISDLTIGSHATKYNFTLETPYGLIIQVDHCAEQAAEATLSVGLRRKNESPSNDQTPISDESSRHNESPSNDNPQQSGARLGKKTESPGYKYRVFPDWGAGFIWYDTAWHGTPEGEYLLNDDDMLERYGDAWMSAYTTWGDHYMDSFAKQECDVGSHKHPFPDMTDRKKWVLDGMMLVVWLCLQPDVISVDYMPDAKKHMFKKDELEANVRAFLEDFDSYLT